MMWIVADDESGVLCHNLTISRAKVDVKNKSVLFPFRRGAGASGPGLDRQGHKKRQVSWWRPTGNRLKLLPTSGSGRRSSMVRNWNGLWTRKGGGRGKKKGWWRRVFRRIVHRVESRGHEKVPMLMQVGLFV